MGQSLLRSGSVPKFETIMGKCSKIRVSTKRSDSEVAGSRSGSRDNGILINDLFINTKQERDKRWSNQHSSKDRSTARAWAWEFWNGWYSILTRIAREGYFGELWQRLESDPATFSGCGDGESEFSLETFDSLGNIEKRLAFVWVPATWADPIEPWRISINTPYVFGRCVWMMMRHGEITKRV